MEYIEQNVDWLMSKVEELGGKGRYLLFDFPGQVRYEVLHTEWMMAAGSLCADKWTWLLQVELYTHGDTVHRILRTLEKWGCRLTAVNLIDAHHCRCSFGRPGFFKIWFTERKLIHQRCHVPWCSDAGKFIAAALVSLVTMIRLELPHVNILSKVRGWSLSKRQEYRMPCMAAHTPRPHPHTHQLDLIESCGPLAFSLDFYTDALDLSGLLPLLGGRYQRLNEALCELIQDFSLVAFQTLNVQDAEALERVLAVVDKCNGYLLAGQELAASASGASARGGGRGPERALHLHERLAKLAFSAMLDHDRVKDVQDRYMEASREGAPIKEADESQ
jgi:acetolactate synthase regulatory subunit